MVNKFISGNLKVSVDIDKYNYSGYGIGFDRKGTFSVVNGFCRNCIIFWNRYEFFGTC